MKQTLLLFFLFFSFTMQSQCFDCNKNLGTWTDDSVTDLKKTVDGLYLIKNSSDSQIAAGIYKYDFNCNLLWKKEIGEFRIFASKITSDSQGNTYALLTWAVNPPSSLTPIYFNDFPVYERLNLYKFDKNGNIIWHKPISTDAFYGMRNLFVYDDTLYVTGTFYGEVTFDHKMTLKNTVSTSTMFFPPLLFISKFSLNGDLLEAKKFGTGKEEYTSSEMDKNGNLYFSTYSPGNSDYTHADIFKIDSNLDLVWKKEISNNLVRKESFFRPTLLHYNPINDKIYLWGGFFELADILGTLYTDPNEELNLKQSLLSEFNVSTGNLERIKQINNSSDLPLPGMDGDSSGNTAYLTEKDNELYILSSFTGIMEFPGEKIESRTYNGGGGPDDLYYKEELVLFKINLNDFSTQFILKSSGNTYGENHKSTDSAGPILFNENDLYLTSSFQSSPLTINSSIINNNSGNNNSDVMLYKYKLDSSINTGEIVANNTCFDTPTSFQVNGDFESILWNFDDPASGTNNTASIYNPEHQFSTIGTYNVTAVVKCGSETQTLNKEVIITDIPNNNSLNPIYACEEISGSGISNSFDTSNVNSTIVGDQTNLIVEYRNSNGTLLPSPLPNPYTNSTKNEEIIKVKSYFNNNSLCFIETDLKLYTIDKPVKPNTLNTTQTFCFQQNATLNDIDIAGQNLKWYDELTAGTLLTNTTLLEDGKTYYASQTINGCESDRVAVTTTILNTPIPTGIVNQTFCTGDNPTLANILVEGENIKWYDDATSLPVLANTVSLQDGKTYYASQTINTCESNRLAITVAVQNTPVIPTGDGNQSFCKIENATLNNLILTGQNLKWYDSDLSTTPLTNATLLENNTTYYASQTVGCESGRFPVLVTIYNTPLPTGNSNQIFCLDQNATISDVIANGNDLKWYDAAVNGNILQNTTILEDGLNYYVSQTLNNCESPRLAITIKIQDTKLPIGENNQKFCVQENATISDINITGQNIKWYNALTGGENLSNMTPLENGKTYYASQTINSCESDRNTFSIQILEATTADCINFEDELPYPKFFTPNNDGYNDTWTIDFAYLAPNSNIRIFNRYGKFIKELSIHTAWDGTYIGRDEPSSDYWFVVTRLNGAEFRGHFTLKR